RVVVTELVESGGARLDLGDAPVVVSGGRGLRAAENFKLVEELAAAFGNAAVGATRAVTDDGWRPPTDQLGQTGRVESPEPHVAGLRYAETLARLAGCGVTWDVTVGSEVAPRRIGTVEGTLAGLLRAERPFLNLLQRAAGIATATRACVRAVAGTPCRILHTRKTAPGLRLFDAAAVVVGVAGCTGSRSRRRCWSRTTTGARSSRAGAPFVR